MFTFANVVKSVRSSVVAAIDSTVVVNTAAKIDNGIATAVPVIQEKSSKIVGEVAMSLNSASEWLAKRALQLQPKK